METIPCGSKRGIPTDDANEILNEASKRVCIRRIGPHIDSCGCLLNINPDAFRSEIETCSIRSDDFEGLFCGIAIMNSNGRIIRVDLFETNALKFVQNLKVMKKILGINPLYTVRILPRNYALKIAKTIPCVWHLTEDVEKQYECTLLDDVVEKTKKHLEMISLQYFPEDFKLGGVRGLVMFTCERMVDGSSTCGRMVDGSSYGEKEHPRTVSFLFDLNENGFDGRGTSKIDKVDKTWIHLCNSSETRLRDFIYSTLALKFPKSYYQIYRARIADDLINLYMYDAPMGGQIVEREKTASMIIPRDASS